MQSVTHKYGLLKWWSLKKGGLLMKFHCILIFYKTAIDVISVLGLLHHVVVGHVANV
jgi:hypothetical protein